MRSFAAFSAFSGALLLAGTAYAQAPTPASPAGADKPGMNTTAPATAPMATTTSSTPMTAGSMWRSSKMIGVDVYDPSNQKVGDISEVLIDPNGKVTGYVIGVGGFLGMGTREIMVTPDKLKFVNEPVRSTAATTTDRTATGTTATTGTTTTSTPTTGTAASSARAADEKWYPDHAVMAATKDELKAMPEFKYN